MGVIYLLQIDLGREFMIEKVMSGEITVLGYNVAMEEKDVHEFQDIVAAIYENGPVELREKLKKMSEKEWIDVMADAWIDVDSVFDL